MAALAWQRLAPQRWPLPLEAFPSGAALVGGAVRDALLDRLGPEPDLDLVVEGDAIALCRQLSRRHGGSAVVLDTERSIARLVLRGWSIDLARCEGDSLQADLRRRDYTVNAMALPLADPGQLLDPLNGACHLQQRQLVAVSEANLIDDPLRLLRGFRLAAELGFELEASTRAWIAHHAQRLSEVAAERVLAELEKLANAPDGDAGLRACLASGLLQPWLLEPPWLAGLQQLSAERAGALGLSAEERRALLPLARLAALLNGRALQRLRSSRKLQQRVERLRGWQQRLGDDPAQAHQQAEQLPEPQRLRLHQQLEADLPALLLSWPVAQARGWLQRWRDPEDRLFHPRAPIDGASLQQQLGLPASPLLGALLQHLMQERAFGRLEGTEQALHAASCWLAQQSVAGKSAPRRD